MRTITILMALTLSQGVRAFDWPKDRSDAVNRLCEASIDVYGQAQDPPTLQSSPRVNALEGLSIELNDAACKLHTIEHNLDQNYCQDHEDFCA